MSGILRLTNVYEQLKNTLICSENYILQSFKNNFFKNFNKDFFQQLIITYNYFNSVKKRNNYFKTPINRSFGLIDKLLSYSAVKELILIIIKGNISQLFELYSQATNSSVNFELTKMNVFALNAINKIDLDRDIRLANTA